MVQSLEIVDYAYLNNSLTAENVIENLNLHSMSKDLITKITNKM